MSVSVDPSVEACQELVARINGGGTYPLPVDAAYSETIIDPLEEITTTRIDVCSEESQTLKEVLKGEGRSSHQIRVWVRSKVDDSENETIDPLKLLVRQVFQRLDNFDSENGRVRVWECDQDQKQSPDKEALRTAGLFVASILLRVEVEASE